MWDFNEISAMINKKFDVFNCFVFVISEWFIIAHANGSLVREKGIQINRRNIFDWSADRFYDDTRNLGTVDLPQRAARLLIHLSSVALNNLEGSKSTNT